MEDTNVSVPKASPSQAGETPGGKVGQKAGKELGKAGTAAVAKVSVANAATSAVGAGIGQGVAAAGGLVDKVIGTLTAPFKAAGAMVGKAMNFVVGGASKIAGAVGGVFGGIGHGIAMVGVALGTAGTVVAGAIGVTTQSQETAGAIFNQMMQDDDIECRTLSATVGDSEGGDISSDLTSERVQKNAYVIYSVLTQYGFTDAQAYGMMANMYHESHLTPSMVQGHISDWSYGESISNPVEYTDNGGGVGLVQWTPVAAKQALYDASVASGMPWYTLEFQMSFILSESDVNWNTTKKYVSDTASFSAEEACQWFLKYWERCGGASDASDHKDPGVSGTYYNQRWLTAKEDVETMELIVKQIMITYKDDADLNGTVSNILSNASEMGSAGASNITASDACEYGTYDNSSAATAAVAYSWPTKDEALNDGTALYQKVYNAILSDRTYYKSCDRNVICAIAWSGTDDNFAGLGGVDGINSYLLSNEGSAKWKEVGKIGSGKTIADCQPGDILIITAAEKGSEHGHVVLFTGEEAITAVHGDKAPSGANVIAASYLDYSPCAQIWSDSTGDGYRIYRCTKPDGSTTYAGAGGNNASETNNSNQEESGEVAE